jgi:hypothetical protein
MRSRLALSAVAIAAAATVGCGRADSTPPVADAAQLSQAHLEMLAPQLLDCGGDAAYFRVGVNTVDSDGKPKRMPLTQSGDSKGFRVLVNEKAPQIVYASAAGESGSQGGSVMLLLDVSGSMLSKVGSKTRFAVAKEAVVRSIATLTGGDRMAVVPFESHGVADHIRRATFQDNRASAQADLDRIAPPLISNDTGLYSAVAEAISRLTQERSSGRSVALVVFTDGANDVKNPVHKNDPGLLDGPEGLQAVEEAARKAAIPIYTIGFGLTTQPEAVTALKRLAFPTADNYKDAATDPSILTEILNTVRIKLSDKYQIFFGPVRTRQELGGGSVPIQIDLVTGGERLTSRPITWLSPGSGDPAPQDTCTTPEQGKVLPLGLTGDGRTNLFDRLTVFGFYAIILVALWFAAPRLMWPDAYIPRPVIPTAQTPNIPGVGLAAPPSPQMPSPDFSRRGGSPPGQGPGPSPIRSLGDRSAAPPAPPPDRTVVVPRGGRPAPPPPAPAPSPRPNPRTPEDERGASDETIYVPPPNRPPKDR